MTPVPFVNKHFRERRYGCVVQVKCTVLTQLTM